MEALTKGIKITDHIHGEAHIICKSDLNGFVVYGFEEDNLMAKNATIHLDDWKSQAEEIMKTKTSTLTVAINNFLQDNGPKSVKQVHNFLVAKHKDVYEDVLDSKLSELKDWANQREHISFVDNKLQADGLLKAETSEYKTPKEYQTGKFKLYKRKDDNLNLIIKVGKESINWLIDTENEKELFDLFGAAGKYPAEVAQNTDNEKVVDEGDIKLGIQRHGYHEYFLEGNKFETKFHVRYLPVGNEKCGWRGQDMNKNLRIKTGMKDYGTFTKINTLK